MTLTFPAREDAPSSGGADRYRLHRAGILNVWQYDEQEFTLADGRMLLRGANGAGKSKTLEMLLPFALDGDKARITASARHHTSLLWLMTDGYDGQARIGYVWVEFLRTRPDGSAEAFTCGVGIRASVSARTATAWHFATTRRVGRDLFLEDDAGPLPRGRLEEILGADGQVFERAAAYKEHIGRALFGLDAAQYDEVLRLLYWLRMPQIGEDIEPAKLAQQLAQALPQLDEQAVKSAGDTFDALTAYGEQLERRTAAAEALTGLAGAYSAYARAAAAHRARAVRTAVQTERALRAAVKRAGDDVIAVTAEHAETEERLRRAHAGADADDARLRELEASPEARDQRRLTELAERAEYDRAGAARAAATAQRRADSHGDKLAGTTNRAHELERQLGAYAADIRDLDRRQREAVPAGGVAAPVSLDGVSLTAVDQVDGILRSLDDSGGALGRARAAVAHRLAAVTVVEGSLRELELAKRVQQEAERSAERAELRWEEARRRRGEAEREVQAERDGLATGLARWSRHPAAPQVDLPEELNEQVLTGLPELARAAAAPHLERLRVDEQLAATRRDNAAAQITRLSDERGEVTAERDPAPPAPALARTGRSDGRALWRLVDFSDQLGDDERAGLEAALQSAGLLDAWLRPGGRLLDAEHRDVVLAADPGPPDAAEQTLAGLLRVDVPPGADVDPEDVRRVLTAIRVDGADAPTRVGTDGTWRLGPAHGRGWKERAQYIGATARAEERVRRLAAIDVALASQRQILDQAQAALAELHESVAALEIWVTHVPADAGLRRAWAVLTERIDTQEHEAERNRTAQQAAHEARTAAARLRESLDALAAQHQLPGDRDALAALTQRVRELDTDLGAAAGKAGPLARELRRWAEDMHELARDADAVTADQQLARAAIEIAERTEAALAELRETAGATVRELEERVSAVRKARQGHTDAARSAEKALRELRERLGAAKLAAEHADERLDDHVGTRAGILASLTALTTPPGLLAAAGASEDDVAVLSGPTMLPASERIPAAVAAVAERFAALTADDVTSTRNRVYAAHREASTGPAADHEPTVLSFDELDLLAVTGRDDAGDAAMVQLAGRVRAAVDRDRGLLTEREKQQFERHVLGELGEAIRRCRLEADELVAAMSALLGGVTTSQGIRVRLDWRLRDDVPSEAREAVRLLGQPVGALLPEERATLRDTLHRLIEVSRVERPELSYAEHLAAALDYRTWSEFTIRYTRPEKPGVWEKLHRRSPLSQGEQKVLCYLPLFAAAAAHFTSLAGAAPHAPRIVLLDDAFPKIDVRTHPLLFGLLVQLDLDFVITSERLWGDHDTVPSLAIYEALRDPSQRGIAQYEYRWDGRALHAVG